MSVGGNENLWVSELNVKKLGGRMRNLNGRMMVSGAGWWIS